jgi:hypothetical protein
MGNWTTKNALKSYFGKENMGANASITNKINRLVGLCEIGNKIKFFSTEICCPFFF